MPSRFSSTFICHGGLIKFDADGGRSKRCRLKEADGGRNVLVNLFNVLGMHEFDSNRKRMSVILGCPDKTVEVFVKGADTSMFSETDKSSNLNIVKATEGHLHSYSSMGLRTLVIGKLGLSLSEFEWRSAYESASMAL